MAESALSLRVSIANTDPAVLRLLHADWSELLIFKISV